MADQHEDMRGINWAKIGSFPQIFKSFRLAIHVTNLVLALAAVIAIGLTGWILDGVWSTGSSYVAPGEINDYVTLPPSQFSAKVRQWRDDRPARAAELWLNAEQEQQYLNTYKRTLNARIGSSRFYNAFSDQLAEANKVRKVTPIDRDLIDKTATGNWSKALDGAAKAFHAEVDRVQLLIDESQAKTRKAVEALSSEDEQAESDRLHRDAAAARELLTTRKMAFRNRVESIRGTGVFQSVLAHESWCLGNAVSAVVSGNLGGGLSSYMKLMRDRSGVPMFEQAAVPLGGASPVPANEREGFLYWVLMGTAGICWLITQHWLFAVIFLLVALAAWALFGGAICRVAALHAAREEKISIMQALRFSGGKFLSFLTAPLIPVAIIVLIGLILAVGGLVLGSWAGGILMGVLFPVALVLGLLIAFLTIGLVGGGLLMYPTIAVEGSDGFDAISRSFSYLFAKPWRATFYGLVALVYGTICYLFVRFFVFLTLAATHRFIGWGVIGGGQSLGIDADKLDVLWPAPTFDTLAGPLNFSAMGGIEPIGAVLIAFWVRLLAATVAAFLLSYLASSTTVIYYLLRRQVDATDFDDVYIEEAPEQAVEISVAPAAKPAEPAEKAEEASDKAPAKDEKKED